MGRPDSGVPPLAALADKKGKKRPAGKKKKKRETERLPSPAKSTGKKKKREAKAFLQRTAKKTGHVPRPPGQPGHGQFGGGRKPNNRLRWGEKREKRSWGRARPRYRRGLAEKGCSRRLGEKRQGRGPCQGRAHGGKKKHSIRRIFRHRRPESRRGEKEKKKKRRHKAP